MIQPTRTESALSTEACAPAHLLHVSGDPGVQQQLQPLTVIPPGGFHRYEQISGGEMLHRQRGGAAPRGGAYSPPIPGQFLEIRRENFPTRRCSWRLLRVSAARVSDGDHERPGHKQTGDRGGSGAGRVFRLSGGFPHRVRTGGGGGGPQLRSLTGKHLRRSYIEFTCYVHGAETNGGSPCVDELQLSELLLYKLHQWAGRRLVEPMTGLSAHCGRRPEHHCPHGQFTL